MILLPVRENEEAEVNLCEGEMVYARCRHDLKYMAIGVKSEGQFFKSFKKVS